MSGPTPGPWLAEKTDRQTWDITDRAQRRWAIAEVWDGPAEAEANARLIAAAPALLKALRDILEEAEEREDTEDCGEGRVQANAWMIVASLCREALDAAGVSHA